MKIACNYVGISLIKTLADCHGTIRGYRSLDIFSNNRCILFFVFHPIISELSSNRVYEISTAYSLPVCFIAQGICTEHCNMIDTHVAQLKRLTALKLDWGRNEEIPFIPVTCIQLSKKLEAYGINHFAEEYLGDHGSKIGGIDGRLYTEMLPFFNTYLRFKE